jgi:hypothetical protein
MSTLFNKLHVIYSGKNRRSLALIASVYSLKPTDMYNSWSQLVIEKHTGLYFGKRVKCRFMDEFSRLSDAACCINAVPGGKTIEQIVRYLTLASKGDFHLIK